MPPASQNTLLRLGTQNLREARGVMTELLFAETLVVSDGHGKPTPGLATGWKWLDDGLALEVWLRTDVTFHDGDVRSTQTASRPSCGSRSRSDWRTSSTSRPSTRLTRTP